jgi:hypothetical protein
MPSSVPPSLAGPLRLSTAIPRRYMEGGRQATGYPVITLNDHLANQNVCTFLFLCFFLSFVRSLFLLLGGLVYLTNVFVCCDRQCELVMYLFTSFLTLFVLMRLLCAQC